MRFDQLLALVSFIFCLVLTLLFVAFRIAGVIAWSVWWVVSPIWIPPAVVAGVMVSALMWDLAIRPVVRRMQGHRGPVR